MAKKAFLLEIGTEEIPARFMNPALAQLREAAARELGAARLSYDEIKVFGTPRRLALLVEGLAGRQQELVEKKKGPAAKAAFQADGTPTKAAYGFARSQGVDVSELLTEDVNGTAYVFAVRKEEGKRIGELLPILCRRLIGSLSFPKPMFWHDKDVRFARPIRWLAALWGKETVAFSFAGLNSGNKTRGHRFLAPEAVEIEEASLYPEILKRSFVIADPQEREKQIVLQVEKAAEKLGGRTVFDAGLLEEVVNLVEYPKAVTGEFSREYLELPQEVLITVMRIHQRYFPVFNADGEIMPYFITVCNGTDDAYLQNVQAGNERVLRARLADARFFFNEDSKQPLADYVDKLDKIVFLEPVGTMKRKTERLVAFVELLSRELQLPAGVRETAARAAYLAKADLMTGMVSEFPELQGTMGMHYALRSGESEEVAVAVHEHYAPRFAGDEPARSLPGALVAIADKMDTLAACFGLGLLPSGSQDPYALRRGAAGVVAALSLHKLTVPLGRLCEIALEGLKAELDGDFAETARRMEDFLLQRVQHSLSEQQIRYDVIDAVLKGKIRDLPGIRGSAFLLQSKLDSPELDRLLTPFTRAANLTRGQKPAAVDPGLFTTAAERELYAAARVAEAAVKEGVVGRQYEKVFTALAPLFMPIERFFDEVMVMTDDAAIRNNRLALLVFVRELFLYLGDLSRIVQEKNQNKGRK